MPRSKILSIYLEDDLRLSAERKTHNFIGKLTAVAEASGFEVEYVAQNPSTRAQAHQKQGRALFHMKEPTVPNGLTFRRVYHYPFWAIEKTSERWEWSTAKAKFDPQTVPRREADKFFERWANKMFEGAASQSDGFVYVPLQGVLQTQRSFQHCSPMDMLEAVLKHDKTRDVVATLHPNEVYSEADIAALNLLEALHPRLTIGTANSTELLRTCDYVVTQNSSAAFFGYFFQKPCILFAKIDFHHIAANVGSLGVEGAFEAVDGLNPDYAGYVHWFWQKMSINAGRPDAEDQIKAALERCGWLM